LDLADSSRHSKDPALAGLEAFARRDFRDAAAQWARAIQKRPNAVGLRVARAHAFVLATEYDSAVAELTRAVGTLEKRERDKLDPIYVSKEMFYYAIGTLQARLDKLDAARDSYQRAIAENLGFYMAHVRLSGVVMMLHDTTTALTELETAMLIRADDPLVLVYHGSVLLGRGWVAEAEKQFRAALRADSDYALPHVFLGLAAERRTDTSSALAEYADYLKRSPRSATERAWAKSRLAVLAPR
jgi:tetratricopeptide (TPR) repeat protein